MEGKTDDGSEGEDCEIQEIVLCLDGKYRVYSLNESRRTIEVGPCGKINCTNSNCEGRTELKECKKSSPDKTKQKRIPTSIPASSKTRALSHAGSMTPRSFKTMKVDGNQMKNVRTRAKNESLCLDKDDVPAKDKTIAPKSVASKKPRAPGDRKDTAAAAEIGSRSKNESSYLDKDIIPYKDKGIAPKSIGSKASAPEERKDVQVQDSPESCMCTALLKNTCLFRTANDIRSKPQLQAKDDAANTVPPFTNPNATLLCKNAYFTEHKNIAPSSSSKLHQLYPHSTTGSTPIESTSKKNVLFRDPDTAENAGRTYLDIGNDNSPMQNTRPPGIDNDALALSSGPNTKKKGAGTSDSPSLTSLHISGLFVEDDDKNRHKLKSTSPNSVKSNDPTYMYEDPSPTEDDQSVKTDDSFKSASNDDIVDQRFSEETTPSTDSNLQVAKPSAPQPRFCFRDPTRICENEFCRKHDPKGGNDKTTGFNETDDVTYSSLDISGSAGSAAASVTGAPQPTGMSSSVIKHPPPMGMSSSVMKHPPMSLASFIPYSRFMINTANGKYRVYRLGERGSGIRGRGEVQDFYNIREDCLAEGVLFEDPMFPANNSSLYFSKEPDRYIEWKRPMEIVDDPHLFVEGFSRFDVQQGELGDCWLLAAVANLTLYRRLFLQIVPDDQFFTKDYAGVFHFRFWQYGKWIDVVVDDRLPTYNGELLFLRSAEKNEFWSALLEKAYAKLHGSYEALKGGSTCEAMEDFTGGVTEMYELDSCPPSLFKILLKAYQRSSLMGCSLEPDPQVLEAETSEGLIRGHAYSITCVRYVEIETPNAAGKIPLVRLRNPWGNEAEWRGAWSDGSPEWRFIPEHERSALGLTFDNDGEFWMSFKDFCSRFSRLEICNLSPDALADDDLEHAVPDDAGRRRWEMSVFEGEWVRGVTAGGCRNFLSTFAHNPQYRITLDDPDEDDEDDKCTVIVALMQKNRRSQRILGKDCLTIGFAVYHLPDPERLPRPLDLSFFKYNASVARSPTFINLREVSCRFRLPPGTYCIVPSTFDPQEQGEFLLRVFSENKNHMEENDGNVGYGEKDERIVKSADKVVTPEKDAQLKELFSQLAGKEDEINWVQLKDILDHSMKKELAAGGGGSSRSGGGFLGQLAALCGSLCGEGPLQDALQRAAANDNHADEFQPDFSKDVCRSMVAMMDSDLTGRLDFEQFRQLWNSIKEWKAVYKMHDKARVGYLNGFELKSALTEAGFTLNNHMLGILMHRYGSRNNMVAFEDFLMCAVRLKTMIDTFQHNQQEDVDSACFTLQEWLNRTVYS